MIDKSSYRRALPTIIVTILIVVVSHVPCLAQSFGPVLQSFLPLKTIESYIGPLIPPEGIGSTFRSEIGTGLAVANLKSAELSGSSGAAFDLVNTAALDEQPLRLDIYANLRLWRFGFRANYWNFDTRSKQRNYGKIDMSGLIVGGDIDLVQHRWLSVGAQTDFFLLDPRFEGVVRSPWPATPLEIVTLDVKGRGPVTVGPYIRYVPPEVLGWPVHLEAFWRIPVSGARLNSLCARLVFRPQIYRFDIAARVLVEKTWFKFRSGPEDWYQNPLAGPIPPQRWELAVEWEMFGIDFSVYF